MDSDPIAGSDRLWSRAVRVGDPGSSVRCGWLYRFVRRFLVDRSFYLVEHDAAIVDRGGQVAHECSHRGGSAGGLRLLSAAPDLLLLVPGVTQVLEGDQGMQAQSFTVQDLEGRRYDQSFRPERQVLRPAGELGSAYSGEQGGGGDVDAGVDEGRADAFGEVFEEVGGLGAGGGAGV
ncbi:hypothetical protein AB0O51_19185 [Streptomyces sp. NPDC090301]|uniref:hypothetical protein n=1 Tax=Streptomyces sp. NPDC090301 TaxID=3154975 RepID=UPI00342C8C29